MSHWLLFWLWMDCWNNITCSTLCLIGYIHLWVLSLVKQSPCHILAPVTRWLRDRHFCIHGGWKNWEVKDRKTFASWTHFWLLQALNLYHKQFLHPECIFYFFIAVCKVMQVSEHWCYSCLTQNEMQKMCKQHWPQKVVAVQSRLLPELTGQVRLPMMSSVAVACWNHIHYTFRHECCF